MEKVIALAFYYPMEKIKRRRPFIYFEDLKQSQIITIAIYAVATTVLLLSFLLTTKENNVWLFILGYCFFTQLSLYAFLDIALRNFKYYLIWLGFGVIHIIFYLTFKAEPGKVHGYYGADAIAILLFTIPLLLLFQLLRFFSLKIQHKEFVALQRYGSSERNYTFIDYLIFIIYMGSLFGGIFFILR